MRVSSSRSAQVFIANTATVFVASYFISVLMGKVLVRLARTGSREVFVPLVHPPGHAERIGFGECADFLLPTSMIDKIVMLDYSVREWVGLLAYRLAGKTDALFPAP